MRDGLLCRPCNREHSSSTSAHAKLIINLCTCPFPMCKVGTRPSGRLLTNGQAFCQQLLSVSRPSCLFFYMSDHLQLNTSTSLLAVQTPAAASPQESCLVQSRAPYERQDDVPNQQVPRPFVQMMSHLPHETHRPNLRRPTPTAPPVFIATSRPADQPSGSRGKHCGQKIDKTSPDGTPSLLLTLSCSQSW